MKRQPRCMRGFEKILLATDGSEFSASAVDEAIKIAATSAAKLFVILVVEMSADVEMWDASGAEKVERASRKHLEAVTAKAERQGVSCETVLHFGDEPYRDIVNEAEKRKAAVIVMGSHGRTGLTRLMMGSVVTRVIGHAPCKVLVVPPKKR